MCVGECVSACKCECVCILAGLGVKLPFEYWEERLLRYRHGNSHVIDQGPPFSLTQINGERE